MFKLEFFSGAESPDNETRAHGYDGSMSVESFDARDLPRYLRSMDCIFGPVVVVVTSPEGYKNAYPGHRTHEAEEELDAAERATQAVVAQFRETIADLQADKTADTILSFGNGLALKIVGPDQAHVCGVQYASDVSGIRFPEVRNGNGERAYVIRRDAVVARQIEHLEGLIAELTAR